MFSAQLSSPSFPHCLGAEDYVSHDLVIVVPRLAARGCANVTVVDDSVVERDEQFRVDAVYSARQPGVLLGTPSEASITISNDDSECRGMVRWPGEE